MRGSIKVRGRWDYPSKSRRGKYDKKYYYWYVECKDEQTNEEITCAPSYKELAKLLGDIIEHEILHYSKTLGIIEARKRYRELSKAMLERIQEEEKRLDKNADKNETGI